MHPCIDLHVHKCLKSKIARSYRVYEKYALKAVQVGTVANRPP